MSRKGQSITLSISDRDKAQLEALAQDFGMRWGDRPNISKLVEAIAHRQLLIAPNHDWSPERIYALERARTALIDAGQIEYAQNITELLLERSELSIPLRAKLEQFFNNPPPPWPTALERLIQRQHPFTLAYRDATDRLWTFTIRHARIVTYEKRQYLECWCEETTGNQDLPELSHNWTLRLDRIPEVATTPVAGRWRPNLDQIQVEMHLSGGLVFAYEPKPEDVENELLPEQPQIRKVVRSVSNSFWFLREILHYGEACLVVTPESMRQKVRQELKALNRLYQLNSELPR